jgi:hypothetical protein
MDMFIVGCNHLWKFTDSGKEKKRNWKRKDKELEKNRREQKRQGHDSNAPLVPIVLHSPQEPPRVSNTS